MNWTVDGFSIVDEDGCLVAAVHNGLAPWNPIGKIMDGGANARLIAAAPDLLEALKNMLADYKEFYDDVYGFGNSEVILAAQAAIARATGEDGP